MSSRRSPRAGAAAARRRVVVLLAAAALLAGVWVPKLSAATPEEPEVHVVRAGENLWTLARAHSGNDDPRPYVHELRRLNRLSTSELFPGQTLVLPD